MVRAFGWGVLFPSVRVFSHAPGDLTWDPSAASKDMAGVSSIIVCDNCPQDTFVPLFMLARTPRDLLIARFRPSYSAISPAEIHRMIRALSPACQGHKMVVR
jgi:hypothetical protein